MELYPLSRRSMLLLLGCLLLALVALTPSLANAGSQGFYQFTALVSNQAGARVQDPNLVNAWGLAHGPATFWWVADNGTGVSTLYDGNGQPQPLQPQRLIVTIPTPSGGTPPAAPTGVVFNAAGTEHPDEFVVGEGGRSGPSSFIFATEDGTISGWNRNVDQTHAILAVDRSTASGGVIYKGLAMGRAGNRDFIYATNFRSGMVEMFDAQFHLVRSFTDGELAGTCPMSGQCYAPFGIRNVGGKLFVTYALQDANKEDDVAGVGNGFVDIFNTNGQLERRFAARGPLDSPWGAVLAPDNFGRFGGALLVGNFGDGHINAYNPHNGKFLGQLGDQMGNPLSIDGLWAMDFGNGAQLGAANELFFTAGPNDEADGLFGKIQALGVQK